MQYKQIDRYNVSDDGIVQNLITGRILKHGYIKGYCFVVLTISNTAKLMYIHRLVAQLFIPNPENKRTVNHINGIKSDNRVENLEWMTHKENIAHAWKTGLSKPHKCGGGTSKKPCNINDIEFASVTDAAIYFKRDQGYMSRIVNKKFISKWYSVK